MNHSYKKEHEQFVSDHGGTSLFEATVVIIITVATCLLRDGLTLLITPSRSYLGKSKSTEKYLASLQFVLDFIILVLPNLLNVTVLSNDVFRNLIIIFISSLCLFMYYYVKEDLKLSCSVINEANLGKRKSFVTNFRSYVNLLTAICILAVDFKVFPRRFAKAETYGYSVMDIGVGFFVVSNAIVSPEARNKDRIRIPLRSQIWKAFSSSIPLVILGIARLLSVKSVDYHEHVTEYGVHWNFFFTLAALKVFSCLFLFTSGSNPLIVGIIIATLHQLFLSHGLTEYLINGADGQGGRKGFLDANREGIVSLPGYFAIYMISIQLGKFIFWKRQSIKEWLWAVLHLMAFFTLSSILMHGANELLQPISRRFSNAAYVFYVISLSILALTVTLIGDIIKTSISYMELQRLEDLQSLNQTEDKSKGEPEAAALKRTSEKTSVSSDALVRRNLREHNAINGIHCKSDDDQTRPNLLESISFNSLLFFLLANLLTGFVNLTMPTIHSTDTMALFVLLGYLLTLCVSVTVLHRKGIATKIW